MTYASEVLADAPVVYLRLGESSGTTAVDSSPNARNGTYVGSPTLGTTSLIGDPDTAVTFDGTDDRVDVVVPSTAANAPFSVEAWLKPTGAGANRTIASRYTSTATAWTFRLDAGNLTFYTNAGSWVALTGPAVPSGRMCHVVATYDGSIKRLYIDGAVVATSAGGHGVNAATMLMVIGSGGAGIGGELWTGVMDEVSYYASALSAARVAAHYSAGIAGLPPPAARVFEAYAETLAVAAAPPRQVMQAYVETVWIPPIIPRLVMQSYVEVLTPAYLHSTHVYDKNAVMRPVYLMTPSGLVAYDFLTKGP